MIELVTALLRYLQAAVEVHVGSDVQVTVLLVGAIAAAAAAIAVTAWRSVPALVAADPSGASTRLRQTTDLAQLISQSDPDAAGRPRPRAPGRGIPAA
ncbi:DUF6412 domain-containing protein [Agromyces bauzanensis]|uniref:Uncharacterized protein n=1 Tax=Agromyces bauzanensis TaxID=1308924 RepID=A0A917PRP6_9MICO|nr:DUF6412 domain-containing protein [Agromyces bauzanensis]GGJ88494.1 hypothetical protein GCM10011372_28860 [Agromyces bauzanensis]